VRFSVILEGVTKEPAKLGIGRESLESGTLY